MCSEFVQDYDTGNVLIEKSASDQVRKQKYRCYGCNQKLRKTPLQGVCTVCDVKLIFSISEESLSKCIEPSTSIVVNYYAYEYLRQTLDFTKYRVGHLLILTLSNNSIINYFYCMIFKHCTS